MNEQSFGFFIPNNNYFFKATKCKTINDYLFIITSINEILAYKKIENTYIKKYIILNSFFQREKIIEIFDIDKRDSIVEVDDKQIVVITESLIVLYYNISDGMFINKINFSNYSQAKILNVFQIHSRFLIIVCKS